MGVIDRGFHFLRVKFEVPRSPQRKIQICVQIHPRSCARALDKVIAMRNHAAHPATMQRYLVRWAAWWSDCVQVYWGDEFTTRLGYPCGWATRRLGRKRGQ